MFLRKWILQARTTVWWWRVAVLAALATPPALAQPSGQAAARLALQEAVQAHGGQGVLESLGDAAAAGTIALRKRDGWEECSLAVKSRGLTAFRVEISCPLSGSRVWITDGRWGWVLVDGVKRPLGLEETADSPQVFNPVLGVLGLFVRGRLQPETVREGPQGRTVVGKAGGTLRPDGSPSADKPMEIELNAATKRVRVLRIWERARDGRLLEEPVEYRYSDWREAAGLAVPFQVEEFRYGALVSRVAVNSFSAARHGDIFAEP